MNVETPTQSVTPANKQKTKKRWPAEISILFVFIGILAIFEILGWTMKDQSFMMNPQRILIMILQVSVIGLLAIGVTQVIITTGIDLSSGSILALSAMVATSMAQSGEGRAIFPSLVGMPVIVPVAAGLLVGIIAGCINGVLVARTGIPAFIATLGMMVSARGLARFYTHGQPISMLTDNYCSIGSGARPVIIFLVTAVIFHVLLRYTKYGKYTYAIGGNMQAAIVSGINVKRHLILVYTLAGLLSGLAGIVASARAQTGQSAMGLSFELDAIASAVIGGTSLNGGIGRIPGTVIGAVILGALMSGFTFLGVDAYIQDIVKGIIIVVAVIMDKMRTTKKA